MRMRWKVKSPLGLTLDLQFKSKESIQRTLSSTHHPQGISVVKDDYLTSVVSYSGSSWYDHFNITMKVISIFVDLFIWFADLRMVTSFLFQMHFPSFYTGPLQRSISQPFSLNYFPFFVVWCNLRPVEYSALATTFVHVRSTIVLFVSGRCFAHGGIVTTIIFQFPSVALPYLRTYWSFPDPFSTRGIHYTVYILIFYRCDPRGFTHPTVPWNFFFYRSNSLISTDVCMLCTIELNLSLQVLQMN